MDYEHEDRTVKGRIITSGKTVAWCTTHTSTWQVHGDECDYALWLADRSDSCSTATVTIKETQ